jgi:hypothetical protein
MDWVLVKDRRGNIGYLPTDDLHDAKLTFLNKPEPINYRDSLLKNNDVQLQKVKKSLEVKKISLGKMENQIAALKRRMQAETQRVEELENTIKRVKNYDVTTECFLNQLPLEILLDILVISQAKLSGHVCKLWDKLILSAGYSQRVEYYIENTSYLNNFCISYVLEQCLKNGVNEIRFSNSPRPCEDICVSYNKKLGWFAAYNSSQFDRVYYKRNGIVSFMEPYVPVLSDLLYGPEKGGEQHADDDEKSLPSNKEFSEVISDALCVDFMNRMLNMEYMLGPARSQTFFIPWDPKTKAIEYQNFINNNRKRIAALF